MGRFVVLVCALAVATGVSCFFEPARPTGHGPGDAGIDAPADVAPDADPCTRTCSGNDLSVVCPSGSSVTTCGWGCLGSASGGGHCGRITPAGGAVSAADLDTTGLGSNIQIDGVVDGDTGSIGTTRGEGSGVVSGIDYNLVGNVAVFRFGSVTITGTLSFAGSHPIAIVAQGPIVVSAPVDARGDCVGSDAGPGGSPGGGPNASASGSGAGAAGAGASCGGGGGGHGGHGGAGGKKNDTAAAGGVAFGDDIISVLAGGGGGGAGVGSEGGVGGGGGGALQLVSSTSITVMAGAEINAGGCGGKPTTNSQPGGGGGAGGTIVLEAPVVTINGAIGTNGGGGAGGDALGQPGQDGITDPVGASGGTSGMSTQAGGSGAAATFPDGVAAIGGAVSSGGGGGAVGRIRITTLSGTKNGSGTITPTLGATGCKAFTAVVQ